MVAVILRCQRRSVCDDERSVRVVRLELGEGERLASFAAREDDALLRCVTWKRHASSSRSADALRYPSLLRPRSPSLPPAAYVLLPPSGRLLLPPPGRQLLTLFRSVRSY